MPHHAKAWKFNRIVSLLAALPLQRRRSRGEQGGRTPPAPPKQKFIEGQSPPPPPPQRFGAENTFTDLFDNTCDIGDFRVHIFCPETTQDLPKKHHEAGPPVQLSTDVLSQINYGHTRHCEDWKEVLLVPTKNAISILENLSRGMRMTEWKMSPPCFKTLRRLCTS